MTPAHLHPGPAGAGVGVAGLVGPVVAAAALLAAAAYLLAAASLRRRGDAWPRSRDVSFAVGGAALAWASGGAGLSGGVGLSGGALPSGGMPGGGTPLGGPFTAHMAQHLIVGMAAPLLLVLARPLTLALRVLPPGRVRRGLLAVAHGRPARWLVFPPLAALLDIGGLWVLYRTELFAATGHRPLLHALVHVHVPAAGLLFAFAVCQLDPVRRRWSPAVRGLTLLAAGAAHAVLAKSLYVAPPPGTAFAPPDLRTGARLMYYGGDLVDVALAVALAAQWYAATGRAHRARPRQGAVISSR
ncbi:cytochrome c oxidase assembly protein [Streptomyces sp. URMC 123]|uniref:cytochrome c oxidase assembly protein n=1 Tax=Streptomyces sp. URMC 123 TaxID=3423403 RepID=UPI003F1988B8